MNRFILFSFILVAWASMSRMAYAQNNILFVGNSFTYVPAESGYNSANVTDLNGSGMGGVPGIFKNMASNLGYSCNVSIEAVAGQNFAYHLANESTLIGQSKWNVVVLQDYSTEPTNAGNVTLYLSTLGQLKTLIRNASPNAKIFLYETWARADLCSLGGSTTFPDLATMLSQLHTNYFNGNTTYNLNGVAPVGDAFALAISSGYADANPYNGIDTGKFNIWDTDSYHESAYGAYLAGAIFIERIAGLDPRNIPTTGIGSAAVGLGLSSGDAIHLNNIAYQATSIASTITNGPAMSTGTVGTAYSFSYATTALPAATTISLASGILPSGLTLTAAGVLSGTPALMGTYTGTVNASNGFGSAATQNFSIAVVGTFSQWAAAYGVSGADATPQHDGVSNLQKYATDINPTKAMTVTDRTAQPTASTAGGGTQLTLTYRVNKLAIGITLLPQTSTDLQNWTTVGTISQIGSDTTTGDPIYQAVTPITGTTKQFIRLKVTSP